jgi:hypothetical protein
VGTSVATVVGISVGVGVATGAAGWDVHPASRIPTNRIARTTKNFFMHLFLLFRYISIFNFYVPGSLENRSCTCGYRPLRDPEKKGLSEYYVVITSDNG